MSSSFSHCLLKWRSLFDSVVASLTLAACSSESNPVRNLKRK